MNVLIDSNIILDVLLARRPFLTVSAEVWRACDDEVVVGHMAAFSIPTIHYVSTKYGTAESALKAVQICLRTFRSIPLFHDDLVQACTMMGSDFEDSIQIACAARARLDGIVTRDKTGFFLSPLRVYSPEALLQQLGR